jgi:hypothetical protein
VFDVAADDLSHGSYVADDLGNAMRDSRLESSSSSVIAGVGVGEQLEEVVLALLGPGDRGPSRRPETPVVFDDAVTASFTP